MEYVYHMYMMYYMHIYINVKPVFLKQNKLLTSWECAECQTCQGPAGCKAAEAQEKDLPEDTDVTGRL